MGNLTFGTASNDEDGCLDRVLEICTMLGLSADILKNVQHNTKDKLLWPNKLSLTQGKLFCIARALISNPEIICLDRPCSTFDHETGHMLMDVFGKFVREKGVEQDRDTWHDRRPRTCIL